MKETPKFVAGNLALDFHNTVSWNVGKPLSDSLLETYDDVLTWAVQSGAIDLDLRDRLLQTMRDDETAPVFRNILGLRQVIRGVFAPLGRGQPVPADYLADLNGWISALPLQIKSDDNSFVWDWAAHPEDLTSVVWPVVWAAGALLRSPDIARIGECEANGCRWLFVDQSRRHNRKWCQMEVCGNREKARRHYRRNLRGR